MGFLDPFGGSSVQSASVSYRAVALASSLALVWPPVATSDTNVVARTMDVTPSGPGFTITMPDATAVSPGYDFLISNLGASSFSLLDNAGGAIATLAPGAARYVQLKTTATAAGTWSTIAFGATAAAPDAAALAGLGLTASASLLQVSLQALTFSSDYVATALDRAKVYIWTGGVGTFTLPTGASATQYYFLEVRNQGTGVLTIEPNGSETIDSQSNIALQPNDSCFVHSTGGSAWYTVGRGRNQQFSFTLLSKAVTTGSYVLTATEASNVVQRYTGALVGNVEIVFPSVVQVYYVSNQTSGAFTLTFRTAGVGSVVTVPSGQNAVLFCDGTNVINNSTTASGLTSLILNPGSVSAPSLTFVGDTSTGIYQPTSSTVAVTTAGVERARWSNTLFNVATPMTVAGLLTASGGLSFSGQLVLGAGSVGTPSVAPSGDANNGWWFPAADTQAWSIGGVELMRLDVSGPLISSASYRATRNQDSFSSRILASTGYTGLRLANEADARRFELFYLGTTQGGLYGASSNDVVQNVNSAGGRYIWSMGDTARMSLSQSGNLVITGSASGVTLSIDQNGANSISAVLTKGVTDGNFQVISQVGAAGSAPGTLQGFLGMQYSGTGKAAGMQFYRGVGPVDAALVLMAGGADRAVLPSTGGIQVNAPTAGIWLQALSSNVNGSRVFSGANMEICYGNYFTANRTEIAAFGGLSIGTTTANSILFLTNNVTRLQITDTGSLLDGANLELGFKGIPRVTSYTGPVSALRGKMIAVSAGITIAASDGWAAGDAFSFYNDSGSAITLAQGGATTLRLAGTATTGSRTLAARGVCTVWANSSSEFIMSGPGLT